MTIGTDVAQSGPYFPNGVVTSFPFGISISDPSDISVIWIAADGTESVISPASYTVTISASEPGGTVVFGAAPSLPAAGSALWIVLDPEFEQQDRYSDEGPFNQSLLEGSLDRQARLSIWLKARAGRSLTLPFGDTASVLPSATGRAGKFLGFDGSGNPIATEGTAPEDLLRAELYSPGGAGLVRGMQAGADAAPYILSEKINRRVDVEDYYRATDGGRIQNAVTRALAAGARKIVFNTDNYNIDSPIAINRDGVSLVGPGQNLCSLNVLGSTPIAFDIGDPAQARFNIYLEGFTVTRAITAAGSLVARIRNVSYFGFKTSRLFMDNKFGTGFDIQSGIYHDYSQLLFNNSIDHNVRVYGGSAAAGLPNGWAVGHRWERCILDGANTGKANPASQASFIADDFVQAMWMLDCEGYRHSGALVDLRGTPANVEVNSLNLFRNLNVETSTGQTGCMIRIGNYANTELSGSWGGGRNMPSVIMLAGSNANRITGNQIATEGSDCIEDSGVQNRIEGNELIGYTGGVAGVRYKAGSLRGVFKGGEVTQMANVVINEAGTESYHRVSNIDTSSISGTPVSGFGSGSNLVTGLRSSDSTPFVSLTGTTLNLPWGLGEAVISVLGSPGNIDNIRPGLFQGETVTFVPQNGMVIRDINTTGGNIVLATGGASISCNGRTMVTFRWQGTSWTLQSRQS